MFFRYFELVMIKRSLGSRSLCSWARIPVNMGNYTSDSLSKTSPMWLTTVRLQIIVESQVSNC